MINFSEREREREKGEEILLLGNWSGKMFFNAHRYGNYWNLF